MNQDGVKLLNIKIYDKTLDMIGRDGFQRVGSRLDQVLGAKREFNAFTKRVCEASRTGLTRLEVSICPGAFGLQKNVLSHMRALWHKRVTAFLQLLEEDVLNGAGTIPRLYRKLSVPDLVGRLRCCKVNLLLIGRDNSWLVNAKTAHK